VSVAHLESRAGSNALFVDAARRSESFSFSLTEIFCRHLVDGREPSEFFPAMKPRCFGGHVEAASRRRAGRRHLAFFCDQSNGKSIPSVLSVSA